MSRTACRSCRRSRRRCTRWRRRRRDAARARPARNVNEVGEGVMDFPLPQLGEGVYEAELVRWLVKPGDVVKRGQALMEVMTDKATMEVPAPFAGKITALQAEPGQTVKVGQVMLS